MNKESLKLTEQCCLQSFNNKNSSKTFTLWHLLIAQAPHNVYYVLWQDSNVTFSNISAKIWNSLKVNINVNVTFIKFKESLKLYLLNNTPGACPGGGRGGGPHKN